MNHATHRETLPGTHILHQELENHQQLKMPHTQDMPFIFKLNQLLMPVSTQIKLLKLMNHVTPQETLLGTHILLLGQVNQLMLNLHHTQDMLFIFKLNQQLMLASTQIKLLKLMNHAILQETLLGTLILLLELESQLMLKLHHIQDTLFIFKLNQLLMLVSTQIKLLKLMNHAILQETLHGTLIPLQELVSQLMLRLHHTQDMPFIFRLIHLTIIALTQTKQLKLMKHALNQETLLGTLTLPPELESQLTHNLHHTQDMLSTEEVKSDQK